MTIWRLGARNSGEETSGFSCVLSTAREYEPEAGLYYYRARFYDPATGRFLQRDPIGPDGLGSLYAYVSNSPAVYVDPMGLQEAIGEVYIINWVDDNGVTNEYVGSTKDFKARVGTSQYNRIINQPGTSIVTASTTGKLDVPGSGQGTPRSAENEALRSQEQPEIAKSKEAAARGELINRNKINAATSENVKIWQERHQTKLGEFKTIKGAGQSIKLRSAGVMGILVVLPIAEEILIEIRNANLGGGTVINEVYEFTDIFGVYILRHTGGKYYRVYSKEGYMTETTYEEWKAKKEQMEEKWGYIDFWGNFVPGTHRKSLPHFYGPPIIEDNEARALSPGYIDLPEILRRLREWWYLYG